MSKPINLASLAANHEQIMLPKQSDTKPTSSGDPSKFGPQSVDGRFDELQNNCVQPVGVKSRDQNKNE